MKLDQIKTLFFPILNSIVIIAFLLLADHSRKKYVQDEFIDDAVQYVNLSFYLSDRKMYSDNGETLTYAREPLPSFLQAIYLKVFTPSFLKGGPEQVLKGRSNLLKVNGINIIYFLAICLAMWWLGFLFFKSHFWALLAILPTAMYLAFYANYLITINSEMVAILLLILVTGAFLKYFKTQNWKWGVLSGFFMGLLTLTKAVFYYLLPIYILSIFIMTFLWKKKQHKTIIQQMSVLVLSYSLVILPWMLRNYTQFNDLTIAKGGGIVLLNRAIMNQMTDEEYIGGYYAYGPSAFNDLFMGRLLGFINDDLSYGGKLQRLNRGLTEDEKALSENRTDDFTSYFYIINNQLIPELSVEANAKGVAPESIYKSQAFKIIKGDLIQHVKMSLLFSWRGIWIYRGQHFFVALMNLLLFISVYLIFVFSLIKKDMSAMILCLFVLYYILFHTLLTHYIPRYSVILLPLLSINFICCVKLAYNAVVNRMSLKGGLRLEKNAY